MARLIWTDPALDDLERIADFISFDNPKAAAKLVRRVFKHVEILKDHPESGSVPEEAEEEGCRQIVEPPCRIFYTHAAGTVHILHVFRSEQKITTDRIRDRHS